MRILTTSLFVFCLITGCHFTVPTAEAQKMFSGQGRESTEVVYDVRILVTPNRLKIEALSWVANLWVEQNPLAMTYLQSLGENPSDVYTMARIIAGIMENRGFRVEMKYPNQEPPILALFVICLLCLGITVFHLARTFYLLYRISKDAKLETLRAGRSHAIKPCACGHNCAMRGVMR